MTTKYRVKIRRVYATTRDIRSVPKAVLPYTNIERGRLKIDLDDIRHCHVVITTTTTAARLHNLPNGHFTHILLDEAGQVLETEAIIPLTLAKQHTCVVLAGDHVQMGPVVSLLQVNKDVHPVSFGIKYLVSLNKNLQYIRCKRPSKGFGLEYHNPWLYAEADKKVY